MRVGRGGCAGRVGRRQRGDRDRRGPYPAVVSNEAEARALNRDLWRAVQAQVLVRTPHASTRGLRLALAAADSVLAHLRGPDGTVAAVDQALGWGTRLASPLVVSLFLGSATSSGSVGLLAA